MEGSICRDRRGYEKGNESAEKTAHLDWKDQNTFFRLRKANGEL
jgi:hypothetical protein